METESMILKSICHTCKRSAEGCNLQHHKWIECHYDRYQPIDGFKSSPVKCNVCIHAGDEIRVGSSIEYVCNITGQSWTGHIPRVCLYFNKHNSVWKQRVI